MSPTERKKHPTERSLTSPGPVATKERERENKKGNKLSDGDSERTRYAIAGRFDECPVKSLAVSVSWRQRGVECFISQSNTSDF